MARIPRQRLDAAVVARGLLPDLRTAQAWILAGKVRVGEQVVRQAGAPVREDQEVALRAPVERYASRGGLKLEAALRRFAVDVRERVALDGGACTGGFTDCLLQHGARRVYAVEVGFGQLKGRLAVDPRVVSLERTNISDLTRAALDPPISLAVFDLSYLSFVRAAPILAELFSGPVELIGLYKPLFEGVGEEEKDDPSAIRAAVERSVVELARQRFTVRGLIPSPIRGSQGTVELLVHLDQSGAPPDPALVTEAFAELARSPPLAE